MTRAQWLPFRSTSDNKGTLGLCLSSYTMWRASVNSLSSAKVPRAIPAGCSLTGTQEPSSSLPNSLPSPRNASNLLAVAILRPCVHSGLRWPYLTLAEWQRRPASTPGFCEPYVAAYFDLEVRVAGCAYSNKVYGSHGVREPWSQEVCQVVLASM